MSTTVDFPELIGRQPSRRAKRLDTWPQASEETRAVDPPLDDADPTIRRNAGAILLLVWLTFLKFGALLLLVAVIVAPLFPGLVVLALAGAILAPPYLLLRRLFRGA